MRACAAGPKRVVVKCGAVQERRERTCMSVLSVAGRLIMMLSKSRHGATNTDFSSQQRIRCPSCAALLASSACFAIALALLAGTFKWTVAPSQCCANVNHRLAVNTGGTTSTFAAVTVHSFAKPDSRRLGFFLRIERFLFAQLENALSQRACTRSRVQTHCTGECVSNQQWSQNLS